MARKRGLTRDYAGDLLFIRRFTTGFEARHSYHIKDTEKLSPGKKAQITRYVTPLKKLTARPFVIYRPRSKKNLEIARESAGISELKKVTGVPIQVPTKFDVDGKQVLVRPKIRVTKAGILRVEFPNFGRETILFENFGFNQEDIAVNPEGVIRTVVENTDYNFYGIIAGQNEVGKGVSQLFRKNKVVQKMVELIYDYNDPDENNFWGNWLFGFNGYTFPNIQTTQTYMKANRDYIKRKNEIKLKIKNTKSYMERLNRELAALQRKRVSKKFTQKQKEKRIKDKERSIKSQNERLHKLIMQRLYI